MKIDSTNIQHGLLDVEQKERSERSGGATSSSETARGAAGGDEVALSSRLHQIRALAAEISDLSAVDTDKVRDLRAQVASGAFTPSADAIARALFGELAANARI